MEHISHFCKQPLMTCSALAALRSLKPWALGFLSHIDPLNSALFKPQCTRVNQQPSSIPVNLINIHWIKQNHGVQLYAICGDGPEKKKLAVILKVYKWHVQNVCIRLVNDLHSHIRHYRVLPWATGPLTLLESIAKVPDRCQRNEWHPGVSDPLVKIH